MRRRLPLLLAGAIANTGLESVKFAFAWYVYDVTKSAQQLALLRAVEFTPQILVGPYIGSLADSIRGRRLIVLSLLLSCVAGLFVYISYTTSWLTVINIFIAMGLFALATLAITTAIQAEIPYLWEGKDLAQANASFTAGLTVGKIIGPSMGGLLIARTGVHMAALFVTTILLTLAYIIRYLPRESRMLAAQKSSAMEGIRSGVRYFLLNHRIFTISLIVLATNLCLGVALSLMVVFLRDYLELTARQSGAVLSLGGVAAAGSGILLSLIRASVVGYGTVVAGVVILGSLLCLLGLSNSVVTVATSYALLMAMVAFIDVHAVTFLQMETPREMVGRILALTRTLSRLVSPIAALLSAALVSVAGIREIIMMAGIVTVFWGLIGLFITRLSSVRHTRREHGRPANV